jgi:hypothetical protein
MSRNIDLTRDRKLRATLQALNLITLGLALCLLVAAVSTQAAIMLSGLYVPFVAGVGANLHLFIAGNVKVHEAQATAPDAPAPPAGGGA